MKARPELPEATRAILRQPLPDSEPRPGFEVRLLAHLAAAPPPRARLGLRGLAGVATAAAVVALAAILFGPQSRPPGTAAAPRPANRPALELNNVTTPLRSEATAVRRSAARAGEFLLSFLPSVPEPRG